VNLNGLLPCLAPRQYAILIFGCLIFVCSESDVLKNEEMYVVLVVKTNKLEM
jgi:hypothetical protein